MATDRLVKVLSKQWVRLCCYPAEAHRREEVPDLREEAHSPSPNPWPERDTAKAPWPEEKRGAQDYVTRRIHSHCKTRSAAEPDKLCFTEHAVKRQKEGHTSILARVPKPTIKQGCERCLLNLNFNNPVPHRLSVAETPLLFYSWHV